MPGPAAIGIDLVEIERLERALARRPRLARRLFSAGELAYAESCPRPGRHLAARFAAKEAVVKALGADGVGVTEVEVVGSEPPRVRLHGGAERAAREQGVELEISLTHTDSTAGAVALAVSR